mmetsp:Transcript_32148/g.42381  ORF Transcript_32148/g.42381 Transcript_32148/m.42381 type:complete len:124 (+) Transcript_32148:3-374(+)
MKEKQEAMLERQAEMDSMNQKQHEKQARMFNQLETLYNIMIFREFKDLDKDQDNHLSKIEIRSFEEFAKTTYPQLLAPRGNHDSHSVFNILDGNSDGKISFEEYVQTTKKAQQEVLKKQEEKE